MNFLAKEDPEQADRSDRERLVGCPVCGQKLFEVVMLHTTGIFRCRCRRCGKYIRVSAIGEED